MLGMSYTLVNDLGHATNLHTTNFHMTDLVDQLVSKSVIGFVDIVTIIGADRLLYDPGPEQ